MNTSSRIAIEKEDGTIESIYCHWDGYYEYNGSILNNFYQEESKVKELISLGGLSVLGTTTDEKIDGSEKGCRDYHRWKGEEIRIEKHKNIEELKTCFNYLYNNEEYLYIYRKNEWYAMKYKTELRLLKEIMQEVESYI